MARPQAADVTPWGGDILPVSVPCFAAGTGTLEHSKYSRSSSGSPFFSSPAGFCAEVVEASFSSSVARPSRFAIAGISEISAPSSCRIKACG